TYGSVTLVSEGEAALEPKCRALAARLRPGEEVFAIAASVPESAAGVMNIGRQVVRDHRWVTVGWDGWLVRMVAADLAGSSPVSTLPLGCRPNAIAEVAVACVGMGELWLRVLGVPRSD